MFAVNPSSCMQVTTTRSNVRKRDIPFVTDPVNKLQAVGKETVAKLKDIKAAAAASGNSDDSEALEDFTCHTGSITSGGPIHQLRLQ